MERGDPDSSQKNIRGMRGKEGRRRGEGEQGKGGRGRECWGRGMRDVAEDDVFLRLG